MLGALIGDIVGSVYEFDNIKTKNFPLLTEKSRFTDDSVMTLAVAEVLQRGKTGDPDEIVRIFRKWGRAFPNAGYGSSFVRWLWAKDPKPYQSCGNGAAMRVSPVGWYAENERQVREYSRAVTSVTHDHEEGLKGAFVTAMCVYLARRGYNKDSIRGFASNYYDLSFDYETLRRSYTHGAELCQNTVPQAIFCFLISESFEDCLRTTISIGGDCDTTAAISCAIAEAYYKKIDKTLALDALSRLPAEKGGCDAKAVLSRFAERKRFLLSPPVPLSKENIKNIDPTAVVAVQSAGRGAMGTPGAVRVYCQSSGRLTEYRFVPENEEDFAFFGLVREKLSLYPPEFCEIYLGAANFLYLKADYKPAFECETAALSPSEIYSSHKEILYRILL